ncbi:unnamed protein product [Clonostachys rosea]|uniref:Uncharacterized protein n=1 Tax=Bionectria ochroleuca TaxID=29856 RepID=A0ABY6V2X2_BIOOC|nr:unnamed protein product [Clonostachys rosea]
MSAVPEFTWEVNRVTWGDQPGLFIHKLSERFLNIIEEKEISKENKEMLKALVFLGSFTGIEVKARTVGNIILTCTQGIAEPSEGVWISDATRQLGEILEWSGSSPESSGSSSESAGSNPESAGTNA